MNTDMGPLCFLPLSGFEGCLFRAVVALHAGVPALKGKKGDYCSLHR